MVITVPCRLKNLKDLIIKNEKFVALSDISQMVNYLWVISEHYFFCLQALNIVFVHLGIAICAQLILD